MNGLQIKLQLDDNQPAHWFDVETINFDDEVCFTDWVGEHIEIEYQGEPLRIKPPSLTDDQQVVLEELKTDQNGWYPFFTIWHLMEETDSIHMPTKEQFQVLAAFAEWGLSTLDN